MPAMVRPGRPDEVLGENVAAQPFTAPSLEVTGPGALYEPDW
jgi:hypothetical protein